MELNTNMSVVIVPVKRGQRLSEVKQIYPLPSNGIFHKRLPGLGATYGEIIAPRHSIIVLPNRPVIESKVEKHNKEKPLEKQILGVYQGITKDAIIAYLSDERITYKKILTTPESYSSKFREIVKDSFDYFKKEYYLLIDECERTIQDIDFREKISAPFDDFFGFTNKGLVSATTLPFSDPRFEEEGFTHYVIEPEWDYCQPLTLIPTNNVVATTRECFKAKDAECYFIFLSSIKAMRALIDALEIKANSKIHCSDKPITELKLRGYKASSTLDVTKLAKYNFLTSRYYSAIDIELGFKPDVLMLTEVIFAEHSILDPQTEVIQIIGRFRNGTNSVTHISNANPEIVFRNEAEARIYMDGMKEVFNQILKLRAEATSEGGRDLIDWILTESKFSRYFNPDGSYNWFMLDNFIQEQRVFGIYKYLPNIEQAYKEVNKHFVVNIQRKSYPLGDNDKLRRETIEGRKSLIMEVTNQMEKLKVPEGSYYDSSFIIGQQNELKKIAPIVVEAHPIIGADGIEQAGYSEPRIKAALDKALRNRGLSSPEFLEDVYSKFKPNSEYIEMYITTTLQDLYDRHNIKLNARAAHIEKFFEARRTTRVTGDKKFYKTGKPLKVASNSDTDDSQVNESTI